MGSLILTCNNVSRFSGNNEAKYKTKGSKDGR